MFTLANTLAAAGFVPARVNLEAAMLAACRAAGASAWYVPDDFLTLGPELVGVSTALVAGTSGYFYSDFIPVVGKSYQIAYQYSVTGGTSVQMSLGGSNVPSSTVGSGSVIYTISAANTNPLRCYSNAATATLTGISVKEVLSAKDFQDSAGTLPAYLGGTVGMIFDAAGVTGPELIANPHTSANWVAEGTTPPTAVNGSDLYLGKSCRSVTFPVIASGGYGVCRARDGENIFNVVAGTTYAVSFEYALSRDLTSGESVAIAVTGSSGLYAKSVSAGALGGVWSPGSGGQPSVASGVGTGLRPYATVLNAPLTVYIRAVSVKVSGGVVATQSTAGNRPVISRIPRKLGPELVTNGTFDADANWTKGTGWSIAGGLATKASGVAANLDQAINLSAKNVAVSFAVSGRTAGTVSALLVESGVGTNTLGGASANGSFTFVGVRPTTGVFRINSDSVFDGAIDNISVREVLEWSYVLTFDGSNDSLATSSSAIGATLTQPYTFIAWGKVGAFGAATRCAVGDSARMLGISTVGKVTLGHGGVAFFDSAYTASVGEQLIMEATYNGTNALNIAVNGVSVYNATAVNPPTTAPGATTVGQRGNSSSYWNGDVGGCIVCPAVMTESQRAAVRKFAAAQMGMAL